MMRQSYLEMMRAHVDEGGQLNHGNARDLLAEVERLNEFKNWVDSWVSNPVGAYSVAALDGLFAMTRDKIAALSSQHEASK